MKEQGVQLGMKKEKVERILGKPKYKEKSEGFESWIYINNKFVSTLYFRNNSLIKIEK